MLVSHSTLPRTHGEVEARGGEDTWPTKVICGVSSRVRERAARAQAWAEGGSTELSTHGLERCLNGGDWDTQKANSKEASGGPAGSAEEPKPSHCSLRLVKSCEIFGVC